MRTGRPSSSKRARIHSAASRSPSDADARSICSSVSIVERRRAGSGASIGRGRLQSGPMTDPDSIFCKIVAGDLPATKVYEDERTIAFMDINPATRGHLLVIPREHAKDL